MTRILEAQIGEIMHPGIDPKVRAGDPIMVRMPPVVHYFNVADGKETPMEIDLATGEERERRFPQF